MISMIKTRTKNYPLVSALLLAVFFAFMLMVGSGLINTSGAEASGPPIFGGIEVGSKVSEDGTYETSSLGPHISVYPQFYYIDGENWSADIAIYLEIRDGVGGTLLFESNTVTDGGGYFFFELGNDPDPFELSPGQYVIIEDAIGTIKNHLVKNLIITEVNMDANMVYGTAESIADTVLVEIRGNFDPSPAVATANFTGVGTEWAADFSAVGIDYSTVWYLRAAELDDDGDRTYQYWGPPHFFIDHHADDLWGYGWSANDHIEVQITHALGGQVDPFTIGTNEHGDFGVNLRDAYGYDVAAGDVLVLTQGSATLTHTIMDLNINHIDPVNDIVSGTADPNYNVEVEIHGNDPDYYVKANRTVTPEINGEWSAVFDPGEIEPGSYGSAEQSYDLSASTRVHWHIPNPHFRVSPDNGNIWGLDWDCGAEITITINDVDIYTVNAGDQPWGGCSDFEFQDETLNLVPGDKVFVTDGIIGKTHYIINFNITEIDPIGKTVSGTAVEDTKLWVGIHEIEESHHEVTAVGGIWIADFSAYDFGPGTSGFAEQWDEDGDITVHNWNIPNPFFMVARDDNSIWGHEWAANTGVTVTINATGPFNTSTDEWGNFDLGDLAGYEIQVGDIVTVSDGVSVFSHTVTNIQITEIDETNSIIRGTVEPGSTNQVEVEIHGLGEQTHPRRLVTPDPATGQWEANFAVAGEGDCPCYQEIYIFGPGTHGAVDELDSAVNARTRVHWQVPSPRFSVNPEDGSIWGNEWACGAEITISINDILYATVLAGNTPWGGCSDFEFRDETLGLIAGDRVTIFDGYSTKTHFILYLEITEVDVTNNTVSGKAEPERIVEVEIHDGMNWLRREAWVNELGDWSVNFTGAIGDEPWQQGYDIQLYDPLSAEIKDDDGDATHIYWQIQQPFFMVDPYPNDIWGHNWPGDTQLTVTIGDPVSPDWSQNVLTDNEGNLFDLWGISYNIEPGHLVTVTDNAGLTKQHIVTTLRDIEVDTENDIVSGLADPNSEVEVHIHLDNYHIGRTVIANGQGYWEADFSVPGSGDCPCEQETHDLGPGSHGSAQQRDEDWDETRIHWQISMQHTITLQANPEKGGSLSGGGLYNHGDQVTITASPKSGYEFVNWTEGGVEVFTLEEYTFTAEGDRDLVANFNAILTFSDVTPSMQFYGYIEAIYAVGITTGYGDGTYRPNDPVTRGQMGAFLARALNLPDAGDPDNPTFTDVTYVMQFFPYIEAIYLEGITTGYGDGTYRPDEPVTRGQMGAFLARALKLPDAGDPDNPTFTDVTHGMQFFPYIEAIYLEGITTGYVDGTYRPDELVTRGQMAAFLSRAFDLHN